VEAVHVDARGIKVALFGRGRDVERLCEELRVVLVAGDLDGPAHVGERAALAGSVLHG
jgi:hypothetical protein